MITTGAVVAGAAVTGSAHHRYRGPIICRPDGRHTIEYHGTFYIVRNDVFFPEQQCLRLDRPGAGFIVTKTHANSHGGDNEAFPEVIYGCAWGLCTKNTLLPRKIYRFKDLKTSWGTSWRRAQGRFNVAYDIWFGHRHTIHGHAAGAELMIWLGTKRFGSGAGNPIYHVDGAYWYYASHRACQFPYGCWNYLVFRRVIPVTRVTRLNLLPFIRIAEAHRQIAWWWWLKSIDVGFEIWWGGKSLSGHNYQINITLKRLPHKRR